MRLVYIYHSGFAIEGDGFSVLFDFYRDALLADGSQYVHDHLLKREGPLYVFASHFHPDHFNPEILTWKEEKPDTIYLLSRDILKRRRAKEDDGRFLRVGDIYQDGLLWVKAFGSTDVGVSFLLRLEGKTIFHAGDLNNWHWADESTPEKVKDAEGRYLKEISRLREETDKLDLAMFPVDPRLGSDFDRGARQLVDRLRIAIFVPMHYWEMPDKTKVVEPYVTGKGTRFCLLPSPGASVEF